MPTDLSALERYRAHINLPEIGIQGQRKLSQSSVLVIGAGGLGSAVLYYLAAAGVGRIGIVDHDVVELNNLQRQILYTETDIGTSKAIAAKYRLLQLNPDLSIEDYTKTFNTKNASLIDTYTIIIDACDNYVTRYAINDACVAGNKPFVYGAISHFEGQVALFNASPGSANYRTLYLTPPKVNSRPSCAKGGVISALPGMVGSIQALEAIKYLVGINTLTDKLLRINALTWSIGVFELSVVA